MDSKHEKPDMKEFLYSLGAGVLGITGAALVNCFGDKTAELVDKAKNMTGKILPPETMKHLPLLSEHDEKGREDYPDSHEQAEHDKTHGEEEKANDGDISRHREHIESDC